MKRLSGRSIAGALAGVIMTGLLAGSAATASGAATVSTLPTLTLTMTGHSVAVGGTPVTGAVDVASTVSGEKQAEPTLLYLKPGATFAQAFAAAESHHGDPNYIDPYGAIVFDALAPKGTSTAQTMLLEPGTYVAVDTIGNNPRKWPYTQFTVAPSAAPAALPAAKATVKAIEFGFRGPSTLRDGTMVRFENAGFLVHMVQAIEVKDAASAKALTALLLAGQDRKAQKLATGFTSFMGPMSPGGVQQFVLHAKPGVYVLACFMDTQDGREHTQLGMERTIRVVK
jgi:hypothetical protein